MRSHHFLGSGPYSDRLRDSVADRERLFQRVAEMVEASGLGVVGREIVPFAGGGLTVVWVLAESHLVLHYWAAEGHATIDLHVCDYRASNVSRARRLVGALTEFCFRPGTATWREMHLDDAIRAAL